MQETWRLLPEVRSGGAAWAQLIAAHSAAGDHGTAVSMLKDARSVVGAGSSLHGGAGKDESAVSEAVHAAGQGGDFASARSAYVESMGDPGTSLSSVPHDAMIRAAGSLGAAAARAGTAMGAVLALGAGGSIAGSASGGPSNPRRAAAPAPVSETDALYGAHVSEAAAMAAHGESDPLLQRRAGEALKLARDVFGMMARAPPTDHGNHASQWGSGRGASRGRGRGRGRGGGHIIKRKTSLLPGAATSGGSLFPGSSTGRGTGSLQRQRSPALMKLLGAQGADSQTP